MEEFFDYYNKSGKHLEKLQTELLLEIRATNFLLIKLIKELKGCDCSGKYVEFHNPPKGTEASFKKVIGLSKFLDVDICDDIAQSDTDGAADDRV